MNITDEGAENLRAAIAEQAIKDYKRAWRRKAKHPDDVICDMIMNDVERFFKGEVFKWMFPKLKGDELFAALQAKCEKESRKDKRGGKP